MIKMNLAVILMLGMLSGCVVAPLPATEFELTTYAQDKLVRVSADQEPISGEITLYDAMARALKHNLDYQVAMMSEVVAAKNLNLKSANMLPQLVAKSGYASQSNSSASYSRDIVTGIKSNNPSVSREKSSFASDATFSWHILDFGLSYIRAQQAADETLIAEERKRKIANRIIEDVRVAYWRAVSSDRLLAGFQNLRHRVERALTQSRKLYDARISSPVAALSFQRELVDIKRQVHRLERELRTSKMQLAALMNVDPSSTYSLHIPTRRLTDLRITASGEDMVLMALRNRPELRSAGYAQRINVKEAEAALLEMLPGISLSAGTNFDSNDFLFNSNWVSYGAKVGWNLMKVFQYPARKQSVEAQGMLLDKKALATTMAIMTQVYVARARYKYLHRSASTAAEYYTIQRKLNSQVAASVEAQVAAEQTLIREEMNTLVAAVQYDLAYADLQNAFAAIYASVGADPYDERISTSMNVAELSAMLKETWRQRGDTHL